MEHPNPFETKAGVMNNFSSNPTESGSDDFNLYGLFDSAVVFANTIVP